MYKQHRDNTITSFFKLHISLYGESGTFQREGAEVQEVGMWNLTQDYLMTEHN